MKLHWIKLREDKSFPNFFTTVQGVFSEVQDGITLQQISQVPAYRGNTAPSVVETETPMQEEVLVSSSDAAPTVEHVQELCEFEEILLKAASPNGQTTFPVFSGSRNKKEGTAVNQPMRTARVMTGPGLRDRVHRHSSANKSNKRKRRY